MKQNNFYVTHLENMSWNGSAWKGRLRVPLIPKKKKYECFWQNCLGLVFFFGLTVLLVFLIWRCRFGFAQKDECFYLTIPYRICQGDKLLIHEWHETQLSGLLLVPFMKAFLYIRGGTEGVVLAFRILFTMIWWLAAVFFFCRLRRFSESGAMIASVCFVLFAPLGIIALSFYSMALLLFLAACILIAFSQGKLRLFIAGFLFAGAVICNPYLVFPWLAFCLAALIDRLFYQKIPKGYWLYTTLGIGVAFLLFCILMLTSAPIREYLKILPFIFDDPEHPLTPFWEKAIYIIYHARQVNRYWFALVLFSLAVTLQTKLCKTFSLGFILVCGTVTALLLSYRLGYHLINFSMFPLSLLGLYCVACSNDSEIRKLFFTIWFPGLLFSFCCGISSSTAYRAFASASTVMTVASVLMAFRFLAVQKDGGKKGSKPVLVMTLAFALTVVVQISCEFVDRYNDVYDGDRITNQTIRAEDGPEKGIWMNPDIYEFYAVTQTDLKSIREDPAIEKVLFLSRNTFLYLNAEKENASYSAWLSGVNDHTVSRLEQYYQLFPEKMPDAVFIDRDYIHFIPTFEEFGYQRSSEKTSEYAYILKKTTDQ